MVRGLLPTAGYATEISIHDSRTMMINRQGWRAMDGDPIEMHGDNPEMSKENLEMSKVKFEMGKVESEMKE